GFPSLPVFCGTRPAKRQKIIKALSQAFSSIADGCKTRHQACVPEQNRNGEISTDRKNVPKQRRVEIHPQRASRVGVWENEKRQPYPSHVDAGKQRGTNNGEYRHRLSSAINPCTPLLPEKQKDRRDQCSRVTDTDPPNEV